MSNNNHYPTWNPNEAAIKASEGRWGLPNVYTNVYKNNCMIFRQGGYTTFEGKEVKLPGDDDPMLEGTKVYSKPFDVNEKPVVTEETLTYVVNADSFETAKTLIDEGLNPAVLNLASARHAGGGYPSGSRAQEESLCRQSTLARSLYPYYDEKLSKANGVTFRFKAYPLDTLNGGVYSPHVTVFRKQSEMCRLMEEPFQTAVISVAALSFQPEKGKDLSYHDPETDGFNEAGLSVMLEKIRTIFRIGLDNGHDSLVLGAFGCGAYRLRPDLVAPLFQQVMQEPEFCNKYKVITFAILDKRSSSHKFEPFYQLFDRK